jgi:hypothetical protein
MSRPWVWAYLCCLLASPVAAEVSVRFSAGQVDLAATAAPLSEVLDRLGRQTGMKVLYEGAAPRTPVTITLHGRTPTETVLAVLEGLGVNYALIGDQTGAGVQTLVIAGSSTAASSGPSRSPERTPPGNGPRLPFRPPLGASPEPADAADDEADVPDEPLFGGVAGVESPDGAAPPVLPPDPTALAAQGQPQPTVPPPGAGLIPQQPTPVSPFTPQPPVGAPGQPPQPPQ